MLNSGYWDKPRPLFEPAEWLYLRSNTHWRFASEWCNLIISAPPVQELLSILWHSIAEIMYFPPREINLKGLINWLKV
jgi:hypothetical protein